VAKQENFFLTGIKTQNRQFYMDEKTPFTQKQKGYNNIAFIREKKK
jgi:hypothetical protein